MYGVCHHFFAHFLTHDLQHIAPGSSPDFIQHEPYFFWFSLCLISKPCLSASVTSDQIRRLELRYRKHFIPFYLYINLLSSHQAAPLQVTVYHIEPKRNKLQYYKILTLQPLDVNNDLILCSLLTTIVVEWCQNVFHWAMLSKTGVGILIDFSKESYKKPWNLLPGRLAWEAQKAAQRKDI